MPDSNAEVDAKGLTSPLPVLRAKVALRNVEPGQVVRLLATDSRTSLDVHTFCDATGHELVAEDKINGVHTFLIRRAG